MKYTLNLRVEILNCTIHSCMLHAFRQWWRLCRSVRCSKRRGFILVVLSGARVGRLDHVMWCSQDTDVITLRVHVPK